MDEPLQRRRPASCGEIISLNERTNERGTPVNDTIHPWRAVELTFTSERVYTNPYTDVEVFVHFHHESGVELVRPAFWDGGGVWKVRFASPLTGGRWTWRSASAPRDPGLDGQQGTLRAEPVPLPIASSATASGASHPVIATSVTPTASPRSWSPTLPGRCPGAPRMNSAQSTPDTARRRASTQCC